MPNDFQLVVRPKRRKKFRKVKQVKEDGIESSVTHDSEQSEQSVLQKLIKCRDEIKSDDFYTEFKEVLVNKISGCLLSCHYEQLTDCEVNKETHGEIPSEHNSALENLFENLLIFQNEIISVGHQSFPKTELSQPKMEDCVTQLAKLKLELVTYGIGHFAECKIAQYQLALMMVLCDQFKLPSCQCYAYDPVWSDVEKSVIQHIGVTLISSNEEGKRKCQPDRLTLFLMPHCGTSLYNNLLWANWSPSQLRNLIIVGNSFQNLLERNPNRDLQEKAGYIYKIYPAIEETPLSNTFIYTDIFNDISIHCFSVENLKKLPENLWQDKPEPVYDLSDIEIIVNK